MSKISRMYIEFFDNNPQVAYQLHTMTGSQLYYALKQYGINNDTINPNQLYDSKIIQNANGTMTLHRINTKKLRNRCNIQLKRQKRQIDKLQDRLIAKSVTSYQIFDYNHDNALVKLNNYMWNRNNYYINQSGIKNEGIGVQQFNRFSSHKTNQYHLTKHQNHIRNQGIKHLDKLKKNHHTVHDLKDTYTDGRFVRSITNRAVLRHNLRTLGVQSLIKVSPIVVGGYLVMRQLKHSLQHSQPKSILSKHQIMQDRRWLKYIKYHKQTYNHQQLKIKNIKHIHNISHKHQQTQQYYI